MHFDWDTVEYVIITIAFGAIGGTVSGAFVADYFANRRARQQRKVELLAFLEAWRSDFQTGRSKYVPEANLSRDIFAHFPDFKIELIAKSTGVEFGYSGDTRETFSKFVSDITSIKHAAFNAENKQKLDAALAALIEFLRKN